MLEGRQSIVGLLVRVRLVERDADRDQVLA